jgi:proteasome lid subunit RPN8/RPN11
MKIRIPASLRGFVPIRDEKEEISMLHTHERCGVLIGTRVDDVITVKEVVEIENIAESPFLFEMSPEGLYKAWMDAEKKGMDVVAVFHTHPTGNARPSAFDLEGLKQTGMPWVIVGIDGIKAFIYRNGIEELEVELL